MLKVKGLPILSAFEVLLTGVISVVLLVAPAHYTIAPGRSSPSRRNEK